MIISQLFGHTLKTSNSGKKYSKIPLLDIKSYPNIGLGNRAVVGRWTPDVSNPVGAGLTTRTTVTEIATNTTAILCF